MIYELRLYSVVPGRLADLHQRFEHLPPLFERHGIDCVGQWSALSGPKAPHFVYMMAYQDFAERETSWASFAKDGDWLALRARTNAGEELVERFDILFLRPNPVWHPDPSLVGQTSGGLHELIMWQTALGQSPATNEFLEHHYLPLVRSCGGDVLGVLDMISGPDMPQSVLMLAWPDEAAQRAAWHRATLDPDFCRRVKEQRRSIGRALLGRSSVFSLEPVKHHLPEASLGSRAMARRAFRQ